MASSLTVPPSHSLGALFYNQTLCRITGPFTSRQKLLNPWTKNQIINNKKTAYRSLRQSALASSLFFASNFPCSLRCFAFSPPPPPLRFLFQFRVSSRRSVLPSMSSPQATNHPSPQSSSSKTVKVVIKGRVQGVFYRDWTVENATQLGLKGWVRNRRDGSVEALFSGELDKVQEMEQRCRRGPPYAIVTGLQAVPCNDDPGNGFEQQPTV